jgi:hypothetical protein
VRLQGRFMGAGLLGLLLVGLIPGVASAANPTIVQFTKNGVQPVKNGAYGAVANFPVGAGRWLVLAKAEVAFPVKTEPHQVTTCALSITGGVGGYVGYVSVSPPNSTSTTVGVPSSVNEGISDSVADALGKPNTVSLRCITTAGANHVFIRHIHITAIRVGTLIVKNLASGTPQVYGTGSPEAVWGWHLTTTAVLSGGTSVGSSMSVPAGNWVAVSSSSIYSSSSSFAAYGYCTLQDSGALDQPSWRTANYGQPGDEAVLTAQIGFHSKTTSTIQYGCHSFVGGATIFYTYIAALRVSKLTERTSDSTVSYGNGTPNAVFTSNLPVQDIVSAHPASLTRSIKLGKGSWVVEGTLSTTETATKDAVVHCQLKVGSHVLDQANSRLTRQTGLVFSQDLVFNGSVKLAGPANALLSCYQTSPNGDMEGSSLHLTAIQGAVSNLP